jgi:hypothetical protein
MHFYSLACLSVADNGPEMIKIQDLDWDSGSVEVPAMMGFFDGAVLLGKYNTGIDILGRV